MFFIAQESTCRLLAKRILLRGFIAQSIFQLRTGSKGENSLTNFCNGLCVQVAEFYVNFHRFMWHEICSLKTLSHSGEDKLLNQDNTTFLAALNFAVKRRPKKVPLIKRLIRALDTRGTFCLPEANEYCTLDFKISQNKILNSLLEEKKTRANTIAFGNELFSLMSNTTLLIPNILQVYFGSEGLIHDQKTDCSHRSDFQRNERHTTYLL